MRASAALLVSLAALGLSERGAAQEDTGERCSADDVSIVMGGGEGEPSEECMICMQNDGFGGGSMACMADAIPAFDHCAVFNATQNPDGTGPERVECRVR